MFGRLWKLLIEHTARYTPEALTEDGRFLTYDAPAFRETCRDGGSGSIIMIIVWIRFIKSLIPLRLGLVHGIIMPPPGHQLPMAAVLHDTSLPKDQDPVHQSGDA